MRRGGNVPRSRGTPRITTIAGTGTVLIIRCAIFKAITREQVCPLPLLHDAHREAACAERSDFVKEACGHYSFVHVPLLLRMAPFQTRATNTQHE